jgi:hypothetical protein
MYVREVKTRHMKNSRSSETDQLRSNPSCKTKLCTYTPNDSKHGGMLYCNGLIEGEPSLVQFHQSFSRDHEVLEGQAPGWIEELHAVERGLEKAFDQSAVFWPRRQASWKMWMASLPYGGPDSLPDDIRPTFAVSRPKTAGMKPGRNDDMSSLILGRVGQDKEGRDRLDFKDGEDVADYKPDRIWVTFNGRTLDGGDQELSKRQRGKSTDSCRINEAQHPASATYSLLDSDVMQRWSCFWARLWVFHSTACFARQRP